uniref:Peptidase S1 domain-containing protein n=1 Tax=Lates calcarifer TaxID=8187 RepID=A0A4W6C4Y5_LATCA
RCPFLLMWFKATSFAYARQIYGGHEAVAHSRPYMVLLERHMQNGETYYCDGFLLTEDFVMTAAHCQGDSGGPLVCEDGKAYGVVSSSHKTNPDGLSQHLNFRLVS